MSKCKKCGIELTPVNSYSHKGEVFRPHSSYCAEHEREHNLKYKKRHPDKIRHLNAERWKKIAIQKPYRLWMKDNNYPEYKLCRGLNRDLRGYHAVLTLTEDEVSLFRLQRRQMRILGRSVFSSHASNRDKRVEEEVIEIKGGEVRHIWAPATCECGCNVIRYDERGYPYCTRCYIIQGGNVMVCEETEEKCYAD